MKLAIALLSGVLAVNAATPHAHHGHRHLHKEKRADNVVVVAGPTVVAYVLDGEVISEQEVQQGIKNGTLVYAANGGLSHAANKALQTSTSSSASSSSAAPSSSAPAPAPKAPAPKPASSSNLLAGGLTQGLNTPFPDGQIDCSHFPADYGAMPVDYMGLSGWIGVQQPGSNSGGLLGNLLTVTKNMVGGGGACTEGSYCSYACPAGYQKSQWPSANQGATGQSVGGLLCQGGKLHLTNGDLSKNLCIPGASQVTVLIQNNCGQNVPVCRTDYPGTEAETVPLNTLPGSTNNLTCPDGETYYHHEGAKTSAQYYVNPKGTNVEDGCQWGQAGSKVGNYAPMNLGVGYSAGAAWLSIFQNAPTTTDKLDFPVTIQMSGSGTSGTCHYDPSINGGSYCGSGTGCSTTTGCTVSLSSGTATFILCPSSLGN